MSGESRNQVRDFLVSRRAKITPQRAGLQYYGGNRRVPGLRREELAMLAGLSVDYYVRLEKGNISGVGDLTLDFEAMERSADAGLTFTAYSAEPSAPSAEALNLLASWTSTPKPAV